eukprot:Amastigsp_a510160_20.p6 type:complete len:107 gc:universal Amastigsp_a510160_20:3016-2696(-)
MARTPTHSRLPRQHRCRRCCGLRNFLWATVSTFSFRPIRRCSLSSAQRLLLSSSARAQFSGARSLHAISSGAVTRTRLLLPCLQRTRPRLFTRQQPRRPTTSQWHF